MHILKLFLLISSTIFIVANSVDNNETNNSNHGKSITSTTRKNFVGAMIINQYVQNNKTIDWQIRIGNANDTEVKINGNFKIIDMGGKILNETNSTFTIPPRKARTYRNKSLKVKVSKDTKVYIQANLEGVISRSNYFIIRK